MTTIHKNLLLLFQIIVLSIVLALAFNRFLFTREAYFNTYENQLLSFRILQIFGSERKYAWIGFAIIPFWLLFKNFIVSLCLQIGLIVNNTKLKFSKTFGITLAAEFIFILPQLLKLAWFLLIKTNYTLIDIQQFYPLSALNLFKIENLSALLIYPFQTFNVFEILYWLLLAGGIKQALDSDINQGIKVVFSGYIPALFLWMLCVMFITVSLGPAT